MAGLQFSRAASVFARRGGCRCWRMRWLWEIPGTQASSQSPQPTTSQRSLSWLRNFANSRGRLWRTPQIVRFVQRLPLLHPSWPARRKRSLNSRRKGWSLAKGQEDSATMSSAATCLVIHRREDLPAWDQAVHQRAVQAVGGLQALEALQASREGQLEHRRAAVSHLKAVATNRLIPSASSLPVACENNRSLRKQQRRSG